MTRHWQLTQPVSVLINQLLLRMLHVLRKISSYSAWKHSFCIPKNILLWDKSLAVTLTFQSQSLQQHSSPLELACLLLHFDWSTVWGWRRYQKRNVWWRSFRLTSSGWPIRTGWTSFFLWRLIRRRRSKQYKHGVVNNYATAIPPFEAHDRENHSWATHETPAKTSHCECGHCSGLITWAHARQQACSLCTNPSYGSMVRQHVLLFREWNCIAGMSKWRCTRQETKVGVGDNKMGIAESNNRFNRQLQIAMTLNNTDELTMLLEEAISRLDDQKGDDSNLTASNNINEIRTNFCRVGLNLRKPRARFRWRVRHKLLVWHAFVKRDCSCLFTLLFWAKISVDTPRNPSKLFWFTSIFE